MAKLEPWFFLPRWEGKKDEIVVYQIHVPKPIVKIIVLWWKISGAEKEQKQAKRVEIWGGVEKHEEAGREPGALQEGADHAGRGEDGTDSAASGKGR